MKTLDTRTKLTFSGLAAALTIFYITPTGEQLIKVSLPDATVSEAVAVPIEDTPEPIANYGLDLVRELEGCRLKAYKDQKGQWTIGWGSTGSFVHPDLVWTQEQADRDLIDRWNSFGFELFLLLKRKNLSLTVNQIQALQCFAYNLGIDDVEKLTKDRRFPHEIAKGMLLYNQVNGKPNRGLKIRRRVEQDLFLLPIGEPLFDVRARKDKYYQEIKK